MTDRTYEAESLHTPESRERDARFVGHEPKGHDMTDHLVKQAIAELQDVVRCRCHAAYKDRGLHDPSCECDSAEAVKVVADRIEALEAKLVKAVDALVSLEKQASITSSRGAACGPHWTQLSISILSARAALAEQEGE